MVDGASVERVTVSNIAMADIESPLFIRLGNRGRAQAVPRPGHLEDVSVADVVATGAERASSITGIPGYPVRRITLRNIRITAKGGGSAALAQKVVPEKENEYPDADMFDDLPAYGLFVRHAETLFLDNVHFHLAQPDARPAVVFDRVDDLDLRAFTAAPPSDDEPVLSLRDVRRCLMQGLRAQPGTRTLCKLTGAQTARIMVLGCDLTDAATPFQFGPDVDKSALHQQANFSQV
jgi:hypothetical protein